MSKLSFETNQSAGGGLVAHAGTHLPGAADALTTAAPTIGIGAANSVGAALSFARSDHDHTIRESGGQDLTLGAIADGETLQRFGNTIQGTGSVAGPFSFNRTVVTFAMSPYTVLATDHLLAVQTSTGAIQILLQTGAAAGNGRQIIVKDENGMAVANNVTITPAGVNQIDGVNAAITIGSNYAASDLYSDGTNYFIL